jgi:tetratricopeptide (TPR) repeat protein
LECRQEVPYEAAAWDPGDAEVFQIQSRLSALLGNLNEAFNLGEHAAALDPLDTISRLQLGYVRYVASRYDEGQAELQKALDLNPQAGFVHVTLGTILIAEEKPRQALAEFEKEPNDGERLTARALVYHTLGREQDSNAALASLIAKHDTDSAYQIAEVYAFSGEYYKAFEWLERAYEQRDVGPPEIKTDPPFKSLRHEPRYTGLLKRMRMPT